MPTAGASLFRGAGEGVALSLSRLSAANGFSFQHRRFLPEGRCRDPRRLSEILSALLSQRLRRDLPFLQRLRIESLVDTRSPSGTDGNRGRQLRGSSVSDAFSGRLGRADASLAGAARTHRPLRPQSDAIKRRLRRPADFCIQLRHFVRRVTKISRASIFCCPRGWAKARATSMADDSPQDLLLLTTDIVAAHVANNSVRSQTRLSVSGVFTPRRRRGSTA